MSYPHVQRLVVFGRSAGLAFAQDCGLDDSPRDANNSGVTALQMAIVQRKPATGFVVHSDRETQYASAQHQGLLKKYGLIGGMSRKGNCWDT